MALSGLQWNIMRTITIILTVVVVTSIVLITTKGGFLQRKTHEEPIPVAARSKAWIYGRWLTGIVGFESHLGHGCLSLVGVVCCQVEVSATG